MPTMSQTVAQESGFNPLVDKMVAGRKLSATDAEALVRQHGGSAPGISGEEDVLRWLASEYGLSYTDLADVEPEIGRAHV